MIVRLTIEARSDAGRAFSESFFDALGKRPGFAPCPDPGTRHPLAQPEQDSLPSRCFEVWAADLERIDSWAADLGIQLEVVG